MNRKLVSALISATAAAASLLGTAGSAYADAPPTGAEACPSGSVCLYYNSPQYGWGSFEHWSPGAYGDLSQFHFSNWGNGSGYGQTVEENAASIVNNTSGTWNVWRDESGYWVNFPIAAGYAGVLPSTVYNHDDALTYAG